MNPSTGNLTKYFSPDYYGRMIASSDYLYSSAQGTGLYWNGKLWTNGMWQSSPQPSNLFRPLSRTTVIPLTREYQYNIARGGFLPYKFGIQSN